MKRRERGLLDVVLLLIVVLSMIPLVSAARFALISGDSDVWGTVLNDFLNVSLDQNGTIRNGTITSAQLNYSAVTAVKIAFEVVNGSHILNSSIVADDIAVNAINSSHILNNNITSGKIGFNAINTTHLIDLLITASKLAYGSVNTSHIGDANVTSAKIAFNAVNTSHIGDANITPSKILPDSINGTELADTIILDSNFNLIGQFNFSVNTSNFVVDTSNGRVGINTTSPSSAFEVSGTGEFTSLNNNSGENFFAGSCLYGIANISAAGAFRCATRQGTVTSTGTNNGGIPVFTDTTGTAIGNSMLFQSEGCLRFDLSSGTCSMSEALVIDGNVSIGTASNPAIGVALEVQYTLRLKPTTTSPTACTAAAEGTIYYDDSDNRICFCD